MRSWVHDSSLSGHLLKSGSARKQRPEEYRGARAVLSGSSSHAADLTLRGRSAEDVPGNSVEKTGVGCPRLGVNRPTRSVGVEKIRRRTVVASPPPLRGYGDATTVRTKRCENLLSFD